MTKRVINKMHNGWGNIHTQIKIAQYLRLQPRKSCFPHTVSNKRTVERTDNTNYKVAFLLKRTLLQVKTKQNEINNVLFEQKKT